jgi:hypothetical protein
VQRSLYVGASNRLDEGADHVIVLITGAVVSDCRFVNRTLDHLGRDHGLIHSGRACSRLLQEGQGPSRVGSGKTHDHLARLRIELVFAGQSPRLAQRPIEQN